VLVEYLIQNESRMNRQDATGSTPLHLAAAGGHAAAVRVCSRFSSFLLSPFE